MNIFKKIGNSVYGVELYTSLRVEKTGPSVKYYFKFIILLSAIWAIALSFFWIPTLKGFLSSKSISDLISLYPAELTLKIDNGQFSTNVKEPYFIKFPKKEVASSTDSGRDEVENFVVIDTSIESFSPDVLKQNDTFVLVTKNSVISDKDGTLQVMPLSNYKDFKYELNRQGIQSFALKVLPVLRPLIYFTPLFMFAIYYISYVWFLIPLFIFALLVWLVLVIKKNNGGYMHAYRVTIHAITLALILNIIYTLIFQEMLSWPILAVITVIIAAINIKKEEVASAPTLTPAV
jgi:hypothetical protein